MLNPPKARAIRPRGMAEFLRKCEQGGGKCPMAGDDIFLEY
jgi:hypothetical protein